MENGYWSALLVDIGLKIAGAIVVWAIGRWLIALAMRLLSAGMTRQKVEPTLIRYLVSFLTIHCVRVYCCARTGCKPCHQNL